MVVNCFNNLGVKFSLVINLEMRIFLNITSNKLLQI